MRIGNVRFFERRKYIGGSDDPLLIRWIVFRVPSFGIFLHKFCRSDYDKALHDHPWSFTSLILRGGYFEVTDSDGVTCYRRYRPGAILFRPAEFRHRVVIDQRPSWSLLFVGRRIRKWGFWIGGKWCWWRKYDYDLAICSEDILHGGESD